MYHIAITFLFAFILLTNAIYAQKSILGHWITDKKNAHVLIYEKEGMLFGKVTWLKSPGGVSKILHPTDSKNPDERLRKLHILGMNVLMNLKKESDNKWIDGKIYDPKKGETYSCEIEYDSGKLYVRGYIETPIIGKTHVWERINK